MIKNCTTQRTDIIPRYLENWNRGAKILDLVCPVILIILIGLILMDVFVTK